MNDSKINELIEQINATIGESPYGSEYGIPMFDKTVVDNIRGNVRQWLNAWLDSIKAEVSP